MPIIKTFGGMFPRITPKLLPDSAAQQAVNCELRNGDLHALNQPTLAATVSRVGTIQTIYRFGQDWPTDDKYWFSFTSDVDVCRAQIYGDTNERTYFTGDSTAAGIPKATDMSLALSGGSTSLPVASYALGVPAPTAAPGVTRNAAGRAVPWVSVSMDPTGKVVALSSDSALAYSADGKNYTYLEYPAGKPWHWYAIAQGNSWFVLAGSGAYTRTQDGVVYSTTTNSSLGDVRALTFNKTFGRFIAAGYRATTAFYSTDGGATDPWHPVTLPISSGWVACANVGSATYLIGDDGTVVTSTDGGLSFTLVSSVPSFVRTTASDGTAVICVSSSGTLYRMGASPSAWSLINTFPTSKQATSIAQNGSGASSLWVVTCSTGEIYWSNDTITWTRAAVSIPPDTTTTDETRAYVYTFVTAWGEESAPSPASDLLALKAGDTVVVTMTTSPPTPPFGGGYNVAKKRIYRTVTGANTAGYLFVTEVPLATQSYTDALGAEDLGESLPSTGWLPPPATLRGLAQMPNGIMAGFTGRDWYCCVPYRPFAWPIAYSQSVDYPIVAHAAFGQTMVVATTGQPYLISGASPETMSVTKTDLFEACVSKRSLVSTGDGVIYASPNGLVYIGAAGAQLATANIFTRREWQVYNPSSIFGFWFEGQYIGFYTTTGGTKGGFIFRPGDAEIPFVLIDSMGVSGWPTAGYVDHKFGILYLAIGSSIYRWNQQGATPLTYTWKSKVFEAPYPVNMNCAQVLASAYPVTMTVYADGATVATQTVVDDRPFRLPSGFRGRNWEVQVSGNTTITMVGIASSMTELASV